MVQVKTRKEFDIQSLAGEILQVLATYSTGSDGIPSLLQLALDGTGASGASFVAFSDPHMTISVGDSDTWEGHEDTLYAVVKNLPESVCLNPNVPDKKIVRHKTWLAFPLSYEGAVICALWLTFTSKHTPSEQEEQFIASVAAGLKIIARNLHTQKAETGGNKITDAVLSSISDPLVAWDENWELVLLNPAAESVFGVTDKESVGKKLAEIIHSGELMSQVMEGKPLNEWTSDARAFVPRTEVVRNSNGKLTGGFLILQDISRYKKLTRNQSEFMRIVSHDLRSPLTSMQGFASMLEQDMVGDLNEKQKHFVSKILSGITQMTALVENIQDAGRYDPESGFYELNRSHTDLDEMANRIVENPLIPADKTLSLSVEVADNVPIIYADASMIERAIINLVDNAIKYTPSGGEINLHVKVANNAVLVAVRDNGLGISKEDQKHLFQRHVRIARQEYKKIKGSGLGLFIVRSVAQRHGGDAWVESKSGEGSTFYFSIPLDDANLVGSASQ